MSIPTVSNFAKTPYNMYCLRPGEVIGIIEDCQPALKSKQAGRKDSAGDRMRPVLEDIRMRAEICEADGKAGGNSFYGVMNAQGNTMLGLARLTEDKQSRTIHIDDIARLPTIIYESDNRSTAMLLAYLINTVPNSFRIQLTKPVTPSVEKFALRLLEPVSREYQPCPDYLKSCLGLGYLIDGVKSSWNRYANYMWPQYIKREGLTQAIEEGKIFEFIRKRPE